MPTIKVSDLNKSRLDVLLALKIGKEQNPAVIMDDVVGMLLDLWEQKQHPKGSHEVEEFYPEDKEAQTK